ncbi:MAG: glycosyltransferase [Lachnospiraceae bacterium]|nr:glycosyltransferase [Lachnospiraceae bacterium]
MNILVLDTHSFMQEDIIHILKMKGHTVFTYGHPDISMHKNDIVSKELSVCIEKNNISMVFSFNYYPIVSYLLKDSSVKYISYVYDSPNIAVYTCSIIFPCNYVFIFDYAVYEELRNGGISTVYYLPLSVYNKRITELIYKNHSLTAKYDISFIGGLYNENHNLYDRLYDKLSGKYEYIKGYLDSAVKVQSKMYGHFFLQDIITDDVLKCLLDVYPYDSHSDSIATPAYAYAHYFLARKSTEIERIALLKAVSSSFKLDLFTYGNAPELPLANPHPAVDYYNAMPIVFNKSKINLNITLKSILTGIPLRCIDIMASEGFLLTNYQSDLFRHFNVKEHFDYFEDEKDLLSKIEYYLNHEDERRTIAENARKLVEKNHDLCEFAEYMIGIAFKEN